MLKKATLFFPNVRLKPSQIHQFRGYIGRLFQEYDIIHNHDFETGRTIYRYPLVQFKLIDNIPVILAITDNAVRIFSEIMLKMDEIVIQNAVIPVYEKNLQIENISFGYTTENIVYTFVSPWLGLNQKNYSSYLKSGNPAKQSDMLKRIVTGNLLSMSKYLDYHLEIDQRIQTKVDLHETSVNLKGKTMIGFNGFFQTNFMIPDNLGIGKSVSRGYGTVRRLI
ncbi:MAG: DNA repair protein [Candidatus Magnetomorum sp.]|nr:DNA repair protein [Candidatus Magnetomorum sp.]